MWRNTPHEKCGENLSRGEVFPHGKCGDNLSCEEISPHEEWGKKRPCGEMWRKIFFVTMYAVLLKNQFLLQLTLFCMQKNVTKNDKYQVCRVGIILHLFCSYYFFFSPGAQAQNNTNLADIHFLTASVFFYVSFVLISSSCTVLGKLGQSVDNQASEAVNHSTHHRGLMESIWLT